MRITRLYTEADGRSRFADVELPSESPQGGLEVTPFPGTEGVFVRTHSEESNPGSERFHTAQRRQYAVMLAGRLEIWLQDGSRRLFVPGDIFRTEDTSGEGHAARTLDGSRTTLYVPMSG